MVFQDGGGYVGEDGELRAPIVFDNLLHQEKMPLTIGIFIDPGYFPPVAEGKEAISDRSFEYDTLTTSTHASCWRKCCPRWAATIG